MPWLLLLASYLLGAVPSSYLAGKLTRGIDLRQHGSGNLGATNTFRVLGPAIALPVLGFDLLKGWAPTFFFPGWDGSAMGEWALLYGVAAIVGHVYPVYMGFRGGKGVATSGGVLLALAPRAVLVGILVWATVVYLTRIVSVASLAAAVAVPPMVALTRGPDIVFWASVGLSLFVVYAHRSNIRRLLRGEEHRFDRRKVEGTK